MPSQEPLAVECLVLSPSELSERPTTGPAWEGLLAVAREPVETPDLSDQNDRDNVRTLARAFVWARTKEPALREEVIAACEAIIGTQNRTGGTTLSLGRELAAYVIAADLVRLPPEVDRTFRAFLEEVRHQTIDGRTLVSTHEDRPNNWGTHAGASRIAVARYLGDETDLARAAAVFRGWLGEREAYSAFRFRDLSWAPDRTRPTGINPRGATIEGHDVDGVLPDDQRRGGRFSWPPPRENYVYEALQGALLQAILLDRAGIEVWERGDHALPRAFRWLEEVADYPAEGDDEWQPHVIAHFCPEAPLRPLPKRTRGVQPGKAFGFTDWLYATTKEK